MREPLRTETPCLVEPVDLEDGPACRSCFRELGATHAPDGEIPQQLVEYEAPLRYVEPVPRGWSRPEIQPYLRTFPPPSRAVLGGMEPLRYIAPAPRSALETLARDEAMPDVPPDAGPRCDGPQPRPASQADLEALRCADCGDPAGDHELVVRGQCHPTAATRVSYHDGRLHVRCAACDRLVLTVAVAP
jgi:ribosomal protein S14